MKAFGRQRILVCDDESTVRLVCERALLQAGYDCVAVGTGLEAVNAARRECFDAILLDVRLPDMDGPEVLVALRETDPDAPCVVISGYSAFDDAIRCLRQGAADFVPKPFDLDTIVRAVDRVLQSSHLKVDGALLAASQSIFSSLEPREVARRVLRVVLSLCRAEEAALTLAAPGAGPRPQIEPTELHRIGDAMTFDEIERDPVAAPPVLRRLLEVHDPVLLRRDNPADLELVQALSPSAQQILVHRLAVGERTLGLLSAARAADARTFGERDMRRLMLIAGHVALALDNARLHVEAAAQARELGRALDRLVTAERIATVGRLSSGIGHEISNPACSVLAYLEVAADAVESGQKQAALDAVERARGGANAVLDVCNALRPLSAGATRKDVVIDLAAIIDGARLLATHELRNRARVVVDLPEKLPVLIGDPAKLGQVLLNLLLNAAQAIEPNSADANQVRIACSRDGNDVLIRVEDSGRGVDSRILPRLFEPSVTTRDATRGHGMGLAICRWIVEEAGGSIRCIPDVERGAAFEVRLPSRPAKPEGDHHPLNAAGVPLSGIAKTR